MARMSHWGWSYRLGQSKSDIEKCNTTNIHIIHDRLSSHTPYTMHTHSTHTTDTHHSHTHQSYTNTCTHTHTCGGTTQIIWLWLHHICTHTHTPSIHTHAHTHMHTHTCTHTHMHTWHMHTWHMHTRTHMHTHTYVVALLRSSGFSWIIFAHTHTHTPSIHTCTHTHAHTHTYTHTCTHMHTHTGGGTIQVIWLWLDHILKDMVPPPRSWHMGSDQSQQSNDRTSSVWRQAIVHLEVLLDMNSLSYQVNLTNKVHVPKEDVFQRRTWG